jgi:hypothetical protein
VAAISNEGLRSFFVPGSYFVPGLLEKTVPGSRVPGFTHFVDKKFRMGAKGPESARSAPRVFAIALHSKVYISVQYCCIGPHCVQTEFCCRGQNFELLFAFF